MNVAEWYFKKFNKDISTHVGMLDCSNSSMTSLDGLPDDFNSELYCSHNKLTSLDGITMLDIDNLRCDWSKEQVREEYKRLNLYELLI